MARAKTTTLALALLLAIIATLSGARVLLIEAAVPPRLWLDDLRLFDPARRQVSLISERNVASLGVLLRDPAFAHARYAACQGHQERASAANDPEDLAASRRDCLGAIDDALASSPGSAGLWLERAKHVTLIDGASDEVFRSLRNSYRLGGREGWLMVRRMPFLANIWPVLPEDLQPVALAELEGVLSSWQLARNLAEIFLSDPDIRLSIITLIETSRNTQAKRGFLRVLSGLVSETGRHLPSAEVAIIAGGEAYQGTPAFRLWADDIMIAEVEVKAAIDTTLVEPVTPQMINDAMTTYFVTVPNIETVKSIAIEFFNDAWAGEGNRGDRNLWIREVSVNSKTVPAPQLVPDTGDAQMTAVVEQLAVLYAGGRFRVDRPPVGWPK